MTTELIARVKECIECGILRTDWVGHGSACGICGLMVCHDCYRTYLVEHGL